MFGTKCFRQRSHRQFVFIAIAIAYLMVGLTGLAFPQISDDEVQQRFLRWIPAAQPASGPVDLFNQYKKKLVAEGSSQTEATRQLAVVRKLYRSSPDIQRLVFNNIYSNSNPAFKTKPNAFLMSTVEGRTPGRALDVGMGQGRNSVFLAKRGWDVTGYDISDEGLAVARKSAEAAGVKLNAVLDSHQKFNYGSNRWDLIAIIYVWAPVTKTDYVQRLYNALRPEGLVVIEHVAEDKGRRASRRGLNPTLLRRAFDGFRIVHFEDKVAKPDWGRSNTRLVRLVAEKRK